MIHRTSRLASRKFHLVAAPALLPLVVAACGSATESVGASDEAVTSATIASVTPVPDGTVSGTYPGYGAPAYQGGPLLTGTVHIRPIFYGTAWQPNYESKMTAMLQQLSSTSYWQVVQGYTDSKGNSPGSLYIDTPEYVTNYPLGKDLHSAQIATVVQDDITAGAWPIGNTYIYMVFTADDVIVGDPGGGLCTSYMGFHSAANFSWTNLIPATITLQVAYAFIGSPQVCLNEGMAASSFGDWGSSINGLAIDVAATTAEHEAAEAVTDPFPIAGQYGWNPEIGDICAWVPGPTTLSGGKYSDLGAGEPYASDQVGYSLNQGSTWLLQTIWDKNQNGCAYGPVADDAITQAAACGSWQCGVASNGIGGVYDCGPGCEQGQTCSSAHTCQGKAITCHTAIECCAQAGGTWQNGHCL